MRGLDFHPDSYIPMPGGRRVALKVHRARWSSQFPDNSRAALSECYAVGAERAEIDIARLNDADFLVVHDIDLARSTTGQGRVSETTRVAAQRLRIRQGDRVTDHHPPLLSEVVEDIAASAGSLLLELDIKDWEPWPWPRVEELARILQPVAQRVTFGGEADWNLRRLQRVDHRFRFGFTPTAYLDWRPAGETDALPPLRRGAYGYRDDHPLALARLEPVADYLATRLDTLVRLVPGTRDLHLRLRTLERMIDDGFTDVINVLHAAGVSVDVWTLDAGTPDWEHRLARALDAGVDTVTTNTPAALASAGRLGNL